MRRNCLFCAAMVLSIFTAGVYGSYITSVGANQVSTIFDSETGILELNDIISLVVGYDSGNQVAFNDSTFSLVTELMEDNSISGQARGKFNGGLFTITADGGEVLLSGQVNQLELESGFAGMALLGMGNVQLDSGTLLLNIPGGYDQGTLWQFSFGFMNQVSDFGSDISGDTNLTITPVPEPATMALLGLGSILMLRKRSRI